MIYWCGIAWQRYSDAWDYQDHERQVKVSNNDKMNENAYQSEWIQNSGLDSEFHCNIK